MSLLSRLRRSGPSGFGYGSTSEEVAADVDLTGKTYLITGCNTGLGTETARVLMSRGAQVIGSARTLAKSVAASVDHGIGWTPVECDLSEAASVRACVATVKRGRPLDGIICNAGITALPHLRTKDGIELQFRTNHLGHFMLVTELLGHLTHDARVVVLSSEAHRNAYRGGIQFDNLDGALGYRAWGAYGQTKLANILFARELARRLRDRQVANAVHPGVIHANLAGSRNPLAEFGLTMGSPLLLKTVAQGAATQTWAAVHPDAGNITGSYLKDCNLARTSALGRDDVLARRLWYESERLVARISAQAPSRAPA